MGAIFTLYLLLFFFLTVKYLEIDRIAFSFKGVDPKSRGDKSMRSAFLFRVVFCHFEAAREVLAAFLVLLLCLCR